MSSTESGSRAVASAKKRSVLGMIAPWGFLVAVCFVVLQIVTWPDVTMFVRGPVNDSAFMRSHPGGRAHVLQTYVPLENISRELQDAVVAAEDARFYAHGGFDAYEIGQAMQEVFARGRVRGASTLSQQLVKNLFLSRSRNPWRKLKEAILTHEVEQALPKDRILELYLNVAQFGPAVFGAEAAAHQYFDKAAVDLDREEAAMLAAALPRPARWHPGIQSERYAAKVANILRRTKKLHERTGRHNR